MHPEVTGFAGERVLVTGATGFTGRVLVHRLLTTGARVRAIVRSPARLPDGLRDAVEVYQGNVYDPEVVRASMPGIRYVFHLAACYRNAGAADDEYEKVHVVSTRLLAEAARQQPDFRRFVHVSTVGVHGHVATGLADETAPFQPGDIYQETKLAGEQWVRSWAAQTELPLTVVRPAAILGPGDRRLLKLFKFARRGVFPLLDGHNTRYHLIHVKDLVSCILLCARHPAARGEVYICGNTEPTDVVSMLTQIGTLLGRRVRFVSLPSAPLFLLADGVEWISKRLGIEPILYRRRLAFFTKDRAFDTRKVREHLGFSPRFTNETGIADTVQGYLKAGWL
ncbi:NAD-dependent epimerase/dehydratase family protein [Rhodocaloribacter litoris]|uniref:NAD-dependent epimerase/dehydratase family protein n=1 Tax=Rhodocaloribacter litoris TaxID=2558931 RepID=UPI001420D3C3|nr:NAD-dependent epimerase/dehydratase family protein [Rhodocaloribacter litoris]QXD16205.1 NAD-dependent epimerase/dehydratase family protein [Rhodocaloribacter litoris]